MTALMREVETGDIEDHGKIFQSSLKSSASCQQVGSQENMRGRGRGFDRGRGRNQLQQKLSYSKPQGRGRGQTMFPGRQSGRM